MVVIYCFASRIRPSSCNVVSEVQLGALPISLVTRWLVTCDVVVGVEAFVVPVAVALIVVVSVVVSVVSVVADVTGLGREGV